MLSEALTIYRELGDRGGEARVLWAYALADSRAKDPLATRRHASQAQAYFEETGDSFMTAWGLYMLAVADRDDGQLDVARQRLVLALRVFADARDLSAYSTLLDCIASIDARSGDRSGAARLSGAVAALDAIAGTGIKNVWNHDFGFDPSSLRDDPATSAAWREGEEMGVDAVVALVLEDTETIPADL